MGQLDSLLWFGEFALALTGALFAFRNYRSIKLFWGYLAFRASADALTFILKLGSDPSDLWALWRWANYFQLMAQYVLLAVLAMRCLGAMVNADQRTIKAYGSLAAFLAGLGIVIVHGAGPWTALYLLQVVSVADFVLGGFMALMLLFREWEVIATPTEKPWMTVCWGLLTAVGTHALFGELLRRGTINGLTASRLMSCGQWLALGVWIVAGWRTEKVEVEEQAAPPRFEPESVTILEENQKWVM